MTKSHFRDSYFGAWTLPFLLARCLPFEMASPVNSPIPTRHPSVVTFPVYSPPSGDPPTRRRHNSGLSFPSPPLSTYSNDMTHKDAIGPDLFPLRPVFPHDGTGFSIASSKTAGLHSRTHSIEFLVAHERSSKAISQSPPVIQVQSESEQHVLCCRDRS